MAERHKPPPNRRTKLRCPKCAKTFVKKEMTISGQTVTSTFRCPLCGEIWSDRRQQNGK